MAVRVSGADRAREKPGRLAGPGASWLGHVSHMWEKASWAELGFGPKCSRKLENSVLIFKPFCKLQTNLNSNQI
jgi:hypothetical protein